MTRNAFWGRGRPDCDEHLLVHKLRKSPGYVPELDFVAEVSGTLVGHILYSMAYVEDEENNRFDMLNFGPLSVLPEYQNQGVGKALMVHTINEAQKLGYRAILFFGHPDYYFRFGFVPAERYGITTSYGSSYDSFMALPLFKGALDGVSGRFYEDAAFDIDDREKDAFDKDFPPKEKAILVPVDILLVQLPVKAATALEKNKIRYLYDFRRYSEREVLAWDGMEEDSVETVKQVLRSNNILWGR